MSSGGPSQPTPYTPPPAGPAQGAPQPPPHGQAPQPPAPSAGYPQQPPAQPQPGYQPPVQQPVQPPAHPGYPAPVQAPAPQPGYQAPPQPPAQAMPPQPPYGAPQQQYSAQQFAASNYTPAQFTQQPGFASALAQPTPYAPPAPVAPSPAQGLPSLPVPKSGGRIALFVLFGFLGLLLLALITYFTLFLGPIASVIGFILALLPLVVVFFVVWMIDRWEPEPKLMVFFALAWGAIAAIGLTLLVDLGLTFLFGGRSDEIGAVVQAPIVEELFKGLGIFLIFLIARRGFDGPVDGVVYGALVGAGFAFTENIQYFAISLLEGGGVQLTMTFFVRAVLSPFAHAMFTCLIGFAMGLAARRHASVGAVLGYGALGWIGAVLLHALWNGSATWGDFFLLYFLLQVPLFAGFILGVIALRREEARVTKARLSDYAAAGWFTPEEINMLATGAGRKVGMRWAAQLRGDRRPLMREFIKDSTKLAMVRQRALTGRDALAAQDEQALLARTRATRAALLAY